MSTKTLVWHGIRLALAINKSVLDLLQITADSPLNLSTNGDALLISPNFAHSR